MSGNIIYRLSESLPTVPSPSQGVAGIEGRVETEKRAWSGLDESDPRALPILSRYWKTVGLTASDWSPSGTPWSAAFVSEVMSPYGLPPAAAHYQYVESVIEGDAPGWKAYRIAGPVKLAPGDVIVRPRGTGTPSDEAYWYSHGDVVYAVRGGRAYWAGGNLGDTLKSGSFLQNVGGDGADLEGDYVILLRPPEKKNVGLPLLAAGALLLGVAVFRK